MVLLVQAHQAVRLHMRVDLCRRDFGVPQHHLDAAQIGAVDEQVAGEGMPQDGSKDRAQQPWRGFVLTFLSSQQAHKDGDEDAKPGSDIIRTIRVCIRSWRRTAITPDSCRGM
jgi:hypothetical protein